MSRPLRLEHPGALWHVTSRGNERREIFRDDADRELFLGILGRVVSVFRWRLYAWVLMDNHYHLLLETPEPNLSRGMRQLNGLYTQRFNRRHGRDGHLMQGRFKSILVEKEAHLLELCRYVVLNPVRAGSARSAREWRWSSYRATADLERPPEWLATDGVLPLFSSRRAPATRRYREFVSEGLHSGYVPWKGLSHQVLLGGEEFVGKAERWMDSRVLVPEIPRRQRLLGRPDLKRIAEAAARIYGVPPGNIRRKRGGPVRLAVALVAREQAALSLREIGDFLGVRSWSASHMATAAQKLAAEDPVFKRRLDALVGERS
ncbi:MAG TPA: transposase [Thermoanaerobaculia bacterium]|nr:transposase [Thermoanaerobaculia bacterium]HQR67546.1 transposase [Thermoanaerobaculia bacterium]